MMTALGLDQAAAIAPGGTRRRGGGPVRRGSAEAGSFEHLFFAEPAPGECDRLLRAAREALDAGRRCRRAARAEGRAMTAGEAALAGITAAALRVYEELVALARLNRGRVFPGYDRLAARTALGRATVARALNALEAAGFLHRRRRYRRVEGPDTDGRAGPRVAQASNAYRPTFPERLAALLPRRHAAPPVPPCEADRARRAEAETAAMRETLTCRELAEATLGGALGRVLARLGAAVDARPGRGERESHDGPGTLPRFILPRLGRHA